VILIIIGTFFRCVRLWRENLGVATSILWNIITPSAVVTLLGGYQKGLEYADLPAPVAVLVETGWVMFGINIFATVAARKYEQSFVSTWYLMGTIVVCRSKIIVPPLWHRSILEDGPGLPSLARRGDVNTSLTSVEM
jgi:cbb3-type cytochrome oxidase subunit 1